MTQWEVTESRGLESAKPQREEEEETESPPELQEKSLAKILAMRSYALSQQQAGLQPVCLQMVLAKGDGCERTAWPRWGKKYMGRKTSFPGTRIQHWNHFANNVTGRGRPVNNKFWRNSLSTNFPNTRFLSHTDHPLIKSEVNKNRGEGTWN